MDFCLVVQKRETWKEFQKKIRKIMGNSQRHQWSRCCNFDSHLASSGNSNLHETCNQHQCAQYSHKQNKDRREEERFLKRRNTFATHLEEKCKLQYIRSIDSVNQTNMKLCKEKLTSQTSRDSFLKTQNFQKNIMLAIFNFCDLVS